MKRDGADTKPNEETGCNIEPLIIKKKDAQANQSENSAFP